MDNEIQESLDISHTLSVFHLEGSVVSRRKQNGNNKSHRQALRESKLIRYTWKVQYDREPDSEECYRCGIEWYPIYGYTSLQAIGSLHTTNVHTLRDHISLRSNGIDIVYKNNYVVSTGENPVHLGEMR